MRLKAENLQRTGSFKIRGAVNKLATLSPEERAAGVVAASAGNHGQAVAWAARELGIARDDLRAAGRTDGEGRGVPELRRRDGDDGAFFEDALEAALAYVDETGGTFIHPYEDRARDRGTGDDRARAAEQVARVGTVLIPIGGGGLALGIAIALRALGRKCGSSACRRGEATATRSPTASRSRFPGELTMPLLEDLLDDIVSVTDEEISEAIVLLLERAKLVVEGAGAVGVAALLAGKAGGSGTASRFSPAGTSTRRCSSPSCATA